MAILKFITADGVLVMSRNYDHTLFDPLSESRWQREDVEYLLASDARQKGVRIVSWIADAKANITAKVAWL